MTTETGADEKARAQYMSHMYPGQEGFLFLINDMNKVLDQHTGRVRLPQKTMSMIAEVHQERRRAVTAYGGEYLHVIAPNKETILADLLLPDYKKEQYGSSPVNRYFINKPEAREFTLFLPDALMIHPHETVYRKGDTHWTHFGAFQYMAAIFSHVPSLQPLVRYFLHGLSFVDDMWPYDFPELAEGAPAPIRRLAPASNDAAQIYFNGLTNRGRVLVYSNDKAPDPRRVLVNHDSFCNVLFDILSSIFGSVVFIHTPSSSLELIDHLRPDLFICLQVERFFIRPPHNQLDLPAYAQGHADKTGIDLDLTAMRAAFDAVSSRRR